jgi:rhodanese-related sulfurtransferase
VKKWILVCQKFNDNSSAVKVLKQKSVYDQKEAGRIIR